MTYAELKAQVLENVGHKVKVGDPQLKRVVNRAIEHTTNIVELTFKPYNVALAPLVVTVVGGTLEYKVGDVTTTPIRKIVLVERTDNTVDPIEVVIIDFKRKNDYGSRLTTANSGSYVGRPLVYFRRVPEGDWFLGFPSDPSTGMSINVYYSPKIVDVVNESDVPREVPEHHHEMIAVRASILLATQYGLDTQLWERQYAELRATLEADLDSWNRTKPRSRRLRSQNAARSYF